MLTELMVSLSCAGLIALGVIALIMPLHKQVLQQHSWSELCEQGRLVSLVLLRIGQCASVIEKESSDELNDALTCQLTQLDLHVDNVCLQRNGVDFGVSYTDWLMVSVSSRLTHERDAKGSYRFGLFIKMGESKAQEWIRGPKITSLHFKYNDKGQKIGVRVTLFLHSHVGQIQNWELYVPLQQKNLDSVPFTTA